MSATARTSAQAGAGPAGAAVLAARSLSIGFPARRGRRAALDVLDHVDLEVGAGEFVAVVGPSGCGKSTLLRALAGLLGPEAAVTGSIARPQGADGRATVAWMPQRDALLPWRRALGNAMVGAQAAGVADRGARERAARLLEEFGLGGFERAWPHELSGGMRQRLALARTCMAGRSVLLLDEPFGALDPVTRRRMNTWLSTVDLGTSVPGEGGRGTVVLVTHDVDEALTLASRVVVLSARPGRVVLDRPAAELDRERLIAALG